MNNLKSILAVLGGGVIFLSALGIIVNQMDYAYTKDVLIKYQKERGIEYAKNYCKTTLDNNYQESQFSQFIEGADNAAREYLELQKLKE